MCFAIRSLISGADEAGLASPNHTIALGAADEVLLVVDGAKNDISSHSHRQYQRSMKPRQVDRMTGEILDLERVHGRKPRSRAPSEVEAEVIMTNIDGSKIPVVDQGGA